MFLSDNYEHNRYMWDWTYVRVLGPDYDSGWRVAGKYPHESAKHHVRKWCNNADDHYYIAKKDISESHNYAGLKREPGTARPITSPDHPEPVFHRQKPWENNFPLPDNMWDHRLDHNKDWG